MSGNNPTRSVTQDEWLAEARQRFGDDPMKWAFRCPVCGHVATVQNWKDAGATEGEVAFSCVGRHLAGKSGFGGKARPCDYAGGGLFRLNPVKVTQADGNVVEVFEFATPEELQQCQGSPSSSSTPTAPPRVAGK